MTAGLTGPRFITLRHPALAPAIHPTPRAARHAHARTAPPHAHPDIFKPGSRAQGGTDRRMRIHNHHLGGPAVCQKPMRAFPFFEFTPKRGATAPARQHVALVPALFTSPCTHSVDDGWSFPPHRYHPRRVCRSIGDCLAPILPALAPRIHEVSCPGSQMCT